METITPSLDFSVKYKQKDISSLLAPFITSIAFTDNLGSNADTIAIELEDCAGRWQSKWYPTKTDELTVSIGYAGQKALQLGTYYIDQITVKAPPSTVTIEGIASTVTEDLKTKHSEKYQDTTLKQIINKIAAKHGMTVVGTISDVSFKHRSQSNKSDLQFLEQLAQEYGYIMAIKGKQLIFTSRSGIKKDSSRIVITAADCISYHFCDTTSKVYKACEVRYWSPATRSLLSYKESVKGLNTGDTLVITERLESAEQAKARAKAALTSANDRQVTGSISLLGSPKYVAGAQIKLEGFGVLSGLYTITSASHSFSRQGWTVDLEINRNELKADDPRAETSGKGTGKSGKGKRGPTKQNLTTNPSGWSSITDDDGNTYPCTNETAARFKVLQALVHERWPGRAFWVSCTTGGTHSSPEHPGGRAIDCGVDGISKQESYTLESLAQQAGFGTYNEYVNSSTYKTGDHMHIYI